MGIPLLFTRPVSHLTSLNIVTFFRLQADLDDLINWANIANDECDFGASLRLGMDLFNHSPTLAPLAARVLKTAYTLLDREPFSVIATQHAKARNPR